MSDPCARLACVALAALFTGTAAAAAPPPPTPIPEAAEARGAVDTLGPMVERRALDWLRAHHHAFDPAAPDAAADAVAARFAGARVVGLGEATHGSHEDAAFKAAVVRALVRRGAIQVLALEAHRDSGVRLDEALRDGADSDAVDRAFHASRLYRVWRSEALRDLLRWVGEWNRHASRPVRIVGIDVQDLAVDAAAALDGIAKRDAPAARSIRARLAPWFDGDGRPREFFGALDRLDAGQRAEQLEVLGELVAVSGHAGDVAAVSAAGAARGALAAYIDDRGEDEPGERLERRTLDLRDRAMAERLLVALGEDSAAVWAHDLHVVRNGLDAFGPHTRTLGTELGERLGVDGYRALRFAWREGRVLALPERPDGGVDDDARETEMAVGRDRGRLGELLARVGPDALWFDLRELPPAIWELAWRARPYRNGWIGSTLDPRNPEWEVPVPLGYGADIVVYIERFTPARRVWPASPLPGE